MAEPSRVRLWAFVKKHNCCVEDRDPAGTVRRLLAVLWNLFSPFSDTPLHCASQSSLNLVELSDKHIPIKWMTVKVIWTTIGWPVKNLSNGLLSLLVKFKWCGSSQGLWSHRVGEILSPDSPGRKELSVEINTLPPPPDQYRNKTFLSVWATF